ncbi:YbaB/EbfC family nucleoid-associated protein [Micromonospora sp. WMMD1120]|uniref:YbaB/EbfC family nucleoid-associated protein n=1 Tax=Micromonospora sp. WMMD1120 TaxID=3016106 RepID=UPI00241767C4|nr:YbaB/EbfC family nucleoid-associated protein [Micromonospora sp. WMMD1120]MDG4809462.1 YbaB/EbfC family nucleoid-associated protein [Micromonospora sp. WMMD1120]
MTDQRTPGDATAGFEAALQTLAEERERLGRLHERMAQGTTTTSKDRMLSVAMNGRGEILKLTFHNTRYRQMAPAELASLITETIAAARVESLNQLADVAGGEVLPGISLQDLAGGEVDLERMVSSFLNASLDVLPPGAVSTGDQARLRGES